MLNHVQVIPTTSAGDVCRRISESLDRRADLNARYVNVGIEGSIATLTGHVSSWSERMAVERAAADAPGISHVDNRLEITGTPL
ncbi:MAG: BON domain-containing protein [Acidobacteria bacterium]|nr:BON domain-containing protein [Acidobacteriota bacterium]